MEEEVFATVDFTKEDVAIEDINKSLKYLHDSCQQVCKLYTCSSIKDQKLRSNIYTKILNLLDVAYHVHNTFESSSLPSSTIGNDRQTWSTTLVCLITDFTNLRRRIMNDYMLRIRNRIYQAMGELVNVSTIMTLFNEYDVNSSNGDDYYMDDDFETMILKKLMKEIHESVILISDGMEELEKVLFETYVMVQKQVILINGGADEKKLCDESSETLVYKENEARDKLKAEAEQRNKNVGVVYLCLLIAAVICALTVNHLG